MNRYLNLLGCLALMTCATAHADDDSLRCNSALISINDSMNTVLRKCGEPVSRSPVSTVKSSTLKGIDRGNGVQVQSTEVPVEQWTYGPTYGMYHYLRFEGDRLVGITGERG